MECWQKFNLNSKSLAQNPKNFLKLQDLLPYILFGNDARYGTQAICSSTYDLAGIGMIDAANCDQGNPNPSPNLFDQSNACRLSRIRFCRRLEDGRDTQIIGTDAFCLQSFGKIVDSHADDLFGAEQFTGDKARHIGLAQMDAISLCCKSNV